VTRFDFLHDGLPDGVAALVAFRLPRRLRTATIAFATLVCVLISCAVFEAVRANAAAATERAESARLDAARERLAAANLELHEVNALLETDRRLHAVRSSGTRAVLRLAKIGNLVPRGVWLASVEPSPEGTNVEGEALNVAALDHVLANLVADGGVGATRLLRMARVARPSARALVSFTLQLQETH
jgi:Tfp pilus assembly protein PilN